MGNEEAETMNRQAVKGYEKALGKEHPDTMTSVYCIVSHTFVISRNDTTLRLSSTRGCAMGYKGIFEPQYHN